MAKVQKYNPPKARPARLEEPALAYQPAKKQVLVTDYTYKKLKKIADLVPFTQAEWAQMLHLSERTLQRYAKNNSSFDGIHTDRILLLAEMIHTGLDTFTDAQALYRWLKKEKNVMGQTLSFESLYSERGIQEIIDQLIRIQQGVYA